MRRMSVLAAALAVALPFAAVAAAPVDLGPGLSDYQRFMAYPHLQRGFDALGRGDAAAAVDAFERARGYAPRSASVALYLADAYRRAGRHATAQRVLDEQRRYTPRDPRLARPGPAQRSAVAVVVAPPVPVSPTILSAPPARLTARRPAPAASNARTAIDSEHIGREITAALESGDARRADRLLAGVPAASFPEARLSTDLALGRTAAGRTRAASLVRAAPTDPGLLDRVTFRLVAAGETAAAARLLLDGWPLPLATAPSLVDRLAALLAAEPGLATGGDREHLARPVAMATESQLRLLGAVGDCTTARRLADADAGLAAPGWAAVAACRGGDRAAELHALRMAASKGADDSALRQLAYRAYDAQDYATALAAWQAVPVAHVDAIELLAAADTAVAADRADAAVAWLDEYARRKGADTDRYWWLRALSGPRGGDVERDALTHAIGLREDARYLSRLAQLQSTAGETSAAVGSLQRAHALAPQDGSVSAALGYALAADDRLADALPLLSAYQAANPGQVAVAEDLAELQRRLAHPAEARSMAAAAIDLLGADADADRVFRLRRLHEQLGRTWSVSADMSLGDAVAGGNAAIPGGAYRSYAQIEADYRLGHRIGRADGDALSIYGRIFAGAQDGGIWPNDLPTLGLGVRWKPLERRILYVAVERQAALDMRRARGDDTLLRISAAPLSDPRTSQDWHASGSGWWSQTVYLDLAHYVESGNSAATADYQAGRHIKVSEGQTVEPFGRVQWNGRWLDGGFDTDARIGLGVRWNHWYGGDRYDAWPHRFVVGVEVQQALTTYLPERQSFFVNVGSYW